MTDSILLEEQTNIRIALRRNEMSKERAKHLTAEAIKRYENRQEAKQFQNPEY
jgi:hypothetical protein